MTRNGKKPLQISLIALIAAVTALFAGGVHGAEIRDLTISEDCRRLVVKFDGDVGLYMSQTLDDPPRLVIDFENAKPGPNLEPSRKLKNKPVKEIRIGKIRSGARVVLELDDYAVPEHKFRPMGDYLIVLLDSYKPLSVASNASPWRGRASHHRSISPAPPEPRIVNNPDESGLFIKTARVANGAILLDVAKTQSPDRVYQIKLEVDLRRHGFNTASIRPLKRKSSARRPNRESHTPTVRERLAAQSPDRPVSWSSEREVFGGPASSEWVSQ